MTTNKLIIKNYARLNYNMLHISKDPYVKDLWVRNTYKVEPLLINNHAVHFWIDLYGMKRTGLSGVIRRFYEFIFCRFM